MLCLPDDRAALAPININGESPSHSTRCITSWDVFQEMLSIEGKAACADLTA